MISGNSHKEKRMDYEVIKQAVQEGKTIQFRSCVESDEWFDLTGEPSYWFIPEQYKVKE
jgi:hypothetical protein